jgi:hypothetical protein
MGDGTRQFGARTRRITHARHSMSSMGPSLASMRRIASLVWRLTYDARRIMSDASHLPIYVWRIICLVRHTMR